jgi:hypothetical protein
MLFALGSMYTLSSEAGHETGGKVVTGGEVACNTRVELYDGAVESVEAGTALGKVAGMTGPTGPGPMAVSTGGNGVGRSVMGMRDDKVGFDLEADGVVELEMPLPSSSSTAAANTMNCKSPATRWFCMPRRQRLQFPESGNHKAARQVASSSQSTRH